jgi:hypothetical protein
MSTDGRQTGYNRRQRNPSTLDSWVRAGYLPGNAPVTGSLRPHEARASPL